MLPDIKNILIIYKAPTIVRKQNRNETDITENKSLQVLMPKNNLKTIA